MKRHAGLTWVNMQSKPFSKKKNYQQHHLRQNSALAVPMQSWLVKQVVNIVFEALRIVVGSYNHSESLPNKELGKISLFEFPCKLEPRSHTIMTVEFFKIYIYIFCLYLYLIIAYTKKYLPSD